MKDKKFLITKDIANQFYTFFANLGPDLSKTIPKHQDKNMESYLKENISCSFNFELVEQNTVKKVIKRLNAKDSSGHDNVSTILLKEISPLIMLGWVGLWGFLWWAPSAKRKDNHGVNSGWSSVWHRSNTGLSSTQYEQIRIILGVWPFWLTPSFFRSITFWRAYG